MTGALESKSGFVRGMDQFSQRFYPLQWLPRELEMVHRAQVRPSVSRRDGFVIAGARAELLRSGFRRVLSISLCVLSDVSCLSACCVKVSPALCRVVWGTIPRLSPGPGHGSSSRETGCDLRAGYRFISQGDHVLQLHDPRPCSFNVMLPRWFLVPSPSHVVDPSIGAAAGGGGSFRGVVMVQGWVGLA